MEVTLTKAQSDIFADESRFRVGVCGRRFGKTYLAGAELLNAAFSGDKKNVYYVCPSFPMANRIMWPLLKDMSPKHYEIKRNETTMTIQFKNGSSVCLLSADNPDSMRGISISFLVLDEYADISGDAWNLVLRPACADQKARVLFIGTPKSLNHFYDLYMLGITDVPGWKAFKFTTLDGGNVDADEIEMAKREMTPHQFRQEFEASFETLTGKIYVNFEREKNVTPVSDNGGPLLIGIDFNIDPMTAVVGVRVADELHIFKEYKLANSNTRFLMEAIRRDFPDREIIAYPDPSGKSRKTSAIGGETDHTIIRSFDVQIIAPSKAPHTADGINNLNTMFMNGLGERRIFVSPTCVELIKDLDGFCYKEDTSVPDKSSGFDHMPDALKYLVWSEFPMISKRARKVKVKGF